LSAGQSGALAVKTIAQVPPAAMDTEHVLLVTFVNTDDPVIPVPVGVTANGLGFLNVVDRPVELTIVKTVVTGAFSVKLKLKLAPVPMPVASEAVTVPECVPPLVVVKDHEPQVEFPGHVLPDPAKLMPVCDGAISPKITPDASSPLLTSVQVVDACAGEVAGDTVLQLMNARLARLFSCNENDADAPEPIAGAAVRLPA
jgi:hypothetical protein